MSNITYIDATYSYYRRLWKNDRWKFSGDMVSLSIKDNRDELTAEEKYALETMNRIIDEHDGNWMQGQTDFYNNNGKPPKQRQMVKKRQPH